MEEFNDYSSKNARINLSRNSPVALVVGAAGFLGSHLSEKLLDHRMQVIGVDNFSTGLKENLEEAVKDNKFHLVNEDAQNLSFSFPRLDYIFIVAGDGWGIQRILSLAREYGTKIIFISWIDLYSHKAQRSWFKKTERELAEFAKVHKLNARVLRLAPVFGPRMSFEVEDPIVSLIAAALEDKLQEESTALEFSSRALFVTDALNLVLKSMLSGSTAWKIFDGATENPVKVTEVKQILLDPIWHENRGFQPTELPPWPTPNLERTQKELHWHPKVDLVAALKETLAYFKEHDIHISSRVHKLEKKEDVGERLEGEEGGWLKVEDRKKEPPKPEKPKRGVKLAKIPWGKLLVLSLILYLFLYPAMTVILGKSLLRAQTESAIDHLQKGQFEESLADIRKAKSAISQIKEAMAPFLYLSQFIIKDQSQILKDWDQRTQILEGSEHLILGTESLYQGLKSVSGEISQDPNLAFHEAQVELSEAEGLIAPAALALKSEKPVLFLAKETGRNRTLALFLPKFIGSEGVKNYLLILQDSSEIRPTGGRVSSLALLSFEGGKLKKITNESLKDLIGKQNAHIEPPKEIKSDLGKADWSLLDANWDVDFPTSAQRIESFYSLSGGALVDGVITLDSAAAGDLLKHIGGVTLLGSNVEISSENLLQQVLSKQGQESLLEGLTAELLNKIIFQNSQNWPTTIDSISNALDEKHMLIFFQDPKLQSIVSSNGWTGRLQGLGGENTLALVEANMGGNKANYFLDRSLSLGVSLDQDGSLTQTLRINYTNRSTNQIWPGGSYKNRLRVFVPLGSQLLLMKWGDEDLTSKVEVATDFGRTVYSLLLNLEPQQTKAVSLDYKLPIKLKIEEGKADFVLNWTKQPGTQKDPLLIKLPHNQIINMNLEKDQIIEEDIFP